MDLTRTNEPENGGPGDLSSPPEQKKQTQEPIHKVLAMARGEGENSYSKNSILQADVSKALQSILIEGLELVSLPDQGAPDAPIVVADLGSSSGANSISNVALIVDKLRMRSRQDPEFQVYFNDLPANDFNNLFQLLSLEDGAKNYFSAGVPGSFYNRLFPRSQVHVFHSAFCLHWMSKVPDALLDKNSPAYNGDNTWYMHPRTAVAAAYKEQSALDLRNFLHAREAELQPGGLLYFTYLAPPNSDPLDRSDGNWTTEFLRDVNDVLSDLVSEVTHCRMDRHTTSTNLVSLCGYCFIPLLLPSWKIAPISEKPALNILCRAGYRPMTRPTSPLGIVSIPKPAGKSLMKFVQLVREFPTLVSQDHQGTAFYREIKYPTEDSHMFNYAGALIERAIRGPLSELMR